MLVYSLSEISGRPFGRIQDFENEGNHRIHDSENHLIPGGLTYLQVKLEIGFNPALPLAHFFALLVDQLLKELNLILSRAGRGQICRPALDHAAPFVNLLDILDAMKEHHPRVSPTDSGDRFVTNVPLPSRGSTNPRVLIL